MALTSLRSLGYDVNPITGNIEPTLAARTAAATAERAEASDIRAEEAATRAEYQLQLSTASAERAERSYELSLARFESDQSKQDAEIIGDFSDYMSGVVGLGDLTSANRPQVTTMTRNWLSQEQYTIGDINRKLEIAKELNQAVTLTDQEIRTQAFDDLATGVSYESSLASMSGELIGNMSRSKLILDEVYGRNQVQSNSGASIQPPKSNVSVGSLGSKLGDWNWDIPLPSLFRF
jgi:hypothetical protein